LRDTYGETYAWSCPATQRFEIWDSFAFGFLSTCFFASNSSVVRQRPNTTHL
jgi:hypothetical protein